MIRTDLDALPVTEQTGLAYASQGQGQRPTAGETGVMHACGHDIHITNLIGAARWFAAHKDQWKGTLIFLGQPAEERGGGAKAMLDDGLFTQVSQARLLPGPALRFGAGDGQGRRPRRLCAGERRQRRHHDHRQGRPRGLSAHDDRPDRDGRPARPDLQTIVSREIKPIEPCVITVGSIHGGTKHNIIGDECQLQLTVRSYTDEVRKQTARRDRAQGQGRRRRGRRAGAEGRLLRRHAGHVQRREAGRAAAGGVRHASSARTTSMTPSRAWGARTSASTAGPACRS